MRYAFIRAEHAAPYIRRFCDLFDVRPRGYYARLRQPRSNQDIAYTRLTGLIQPFWLETGGVYGYRKVYSDLLELGKVVVRTGFIVLCVQLDSSSSRLSATTTSKWPTRCCCSNV